MPVPLRVTCWGLVVALSLTVKVAGWAPVALGVNATPSVHDPSAATVTGIAPQVPVPLRTYSGSEGEALETISGWVLPVLWIVRFFVTVSPKETFPNASDAVTVIEVVGVGVGAKVVVTVGVAGGVPPGLGVTVIVAVGAGVPPLDGVAVGLAIGVGVGGTTPPYSNAPMSQALCPGAGRGAPRWSVAGQLAAGIAAIARLPDSSAMVFVSPPLFARPLGSRAILLPLTLSPIISPLAARLFPRSQVPSSEMS